MRQQNSFLMGVILPAIAIMGLAYCPSGLAKTSDRDAPIHIEADRVEVRERDNISIYQGHVKIQRGSIKISGQKIIIRNKNGVLQRIEITGNPARFEQLNDLGEQIITQSQLMEYHATSGLLELKEKAVLIKNQNRFSSEHIIYDSHNDIVKAGHNQQRARQAEKNQALPEGNGQSETPRVKITIQPPANGN